MNRRPMRTIMATWHTMLVFQTIGTVDGQHKLPAPKQYVAHSVVWGVLFLMADTGLGRLAARLSMLVLLTATVLGPFGKTAVSFLQRVAGPTFATAPASAETPLGPGQEPPQLA